MTTKAANKAASAAIEKMLGTRWCSSCQRHRPTDGGSIKVTGKGRTVRRWQCVTCLERRS